jgi:predicted adenine nucleotide alpha hydrolase (AANH) superfamily ATPase
VYDHNLTDEEREKLGFILTEEEYRRFTSENTALADLFRLFFHRGDWAKAKEYLKKIKNESYKRDIFFLALGGCLIFSKEQAEWRRKAEEYFRDAFEDA